MTEKLMGTSFSLISVRYSFIKAGSTWRLNYTKCIYRLARETVGGGDLWNGDVENWVIWNIFDVDRMNRRVGVLKERKWIRENIFRTGWNRSNLNHVFKCIINWQVRRTYFGVMKTFYFWASCLDDNYEADKWRFGFVILRYHFKKPADHIVSSERTVAITDRNHTYVCWCWMLKPNWMRLLKLWFLKCLSTFSITIFSQILKLSLSFNDCLKSNFFYFFKKIKIIVFIVNYYCILL